MVDFYEMLGGARRLMPINPPSKAEANNPFLTGLVGMLVAVNNDINLCRYKPDLDYGAALPPLRQKAPDDLVGRMVLRHSRVRRTPKAAFEVIRWLTPKDRSKERRSTGLHLGAGEASTTFPSLCLYTNQRLHD